MPNMKYFTKTTLFAPTLSLILSAAGLTTAQDAPPAPPKAETKPAPPAGSEDPVPAGLSKFPSPEAMHSYALGMYFGPNNRYFFQKQDLDLAALKQGLDDVFKAKKDFSYAVGVSVALQIAHRNAEIDVDQLFSGLKDSFEYQETKLTREEQREAMNNLEAGLKEKRNQEIVASAPANEQKGKEFLAKNATREEVKTTESGLQYEAIKEGSGDKKPGDTDTVSVNYTGTLLTGKVFDKTDAGTPKRLSLKSRYLIKGWKEGLMLMSPGAHYKFYIPHDLAYGMEPKNNSIGGNEALIMDVELVSTEPPRAPTGPGRRPGASAVTPPVRVPLKNNKPKATAVTPPVKVEFPKGGKDAKRDVRVTPPVKVEFPKKGAKGDIKVTPPVRIPPKKKDGDKE
jgi:FKBP-type peptidyl-prolyl cis-trans isomerase FklB